MNDSVLNIPLLQMAFAFIPVLIVIAVMFRWHLQGWKALYAIVRMLLQLLLIGFFLLYILATEYAAIVIAILAVMLFAAGWIALTPFKYKQPRLYLKVLSAIAIGGLSTLMLIIFAVLQPDPWYAPRYVIPVAGMVFATAMNAVSLAAERLLAELSSGREYLHARALALQAALIPQINTMLAVGLVSLPGMMTGQILSGVSPVIAVRYQIMILCAVFGSSGIAAACYLYLQKPNPTE